MAVLDVVKGSRWGMSPTEQTVSLNGRRFSHMSDTLKHRASEMALGGVARAKQRRASQFNAGGERGCSPNTDEVNVDVH